MSIRKTPDLGGGSKGAKIVNFGTLISALGPRPTTHTCLNEIRSNVKSLYHFKERRLLRGGLVLPSIGGSVPCFACKGLGHISNVGMGCSRA